MAFARLFFARECAAFIGQRQADGLIGGRFFRKVGFAEIHAPWRLPRPGAGFILTALLMLGYVELMT